MVNSPDLRGKEATGTANVQAVKTNSRIAAVNSFIAWLLAFRSGPLALTKYSILTTDLVPFIYNALHFRCSASGGIFRALFALEHPGNHPGHKRAVEDLHISRRGNSGNAQIG